jgi:hypothetical protein
MINAFPALIALVAALLHGSPTLQSSSDRIFTAKSETIPQGKG